MRTGQIPIFLSMVFLLVTVQHRVSMAGENNIDFHGFLLGNVAGRTTGLRPGGGDDFLIVEERSRLDLYAWSETIDASGQIKGDIVHDALAEEFYVDLREAYIDYTAGSFDLRLGRQVVTWGVGDLLFINDVFTKDWVSFFAGRPLEYLKVGVDGFRARYSSGVLNMDFVVVPRFREDILPTPAQFFLFDPFSGGEVTGTTLPEARFGNSEIAMRVYGRLAGFDLSGHAYRGFWRSPSAAPSTVEDEYQFTLFYPELSVYGVSAQRSGLGGLVSLEAGYYESSEDRAGDDPYIPNSQSRFLVGYQRQMAEDLHLDVQYYAEIMSKHSGYLKTLPPGFPAGDELRDIITIRLEQFLEYHTWKLTLFTFYGRTDEDYLVQPQMTHNISDDLSLTLGGNIFGGRDETTFLAQFDRDDNAYLSARFDF